MRNYAMEVVMMIGLAIVFVGMGIGMFVNAIAGMTVIVTGFGIAFLGMLIVSVIEDINSRRKRAKN